MQPSKGREDVKLLQKIVAKFQPLASSFHLKAQREPVPLKLQLITKSYKIEFRGGIKRMKLVADISQFGICSLVNVCVRFINIMNIYYV